MAREYVKTINGRTIYKIILEQGMGEMVAEKFQVDNEQPNHPSQFDTLQEAEAYCGNN